MRLAWSVFRGFLLAICPSILVTACIYSLAERDERLEFSSWFGHLVLQAETVHLTVSGWGGYDEDTKKLRLNSVSIKPVGSHDHRLVWSIDDTDQPTTDDVVQLINTGKNQLSGPQSLLRATKVKSLVDRLLDSDPLLYVNSNTLLQHESIGDWDVFYSSNVWVSGHSMYGYIFAGLVAGVVTLGIGVALSVALTRRAVRKGNTP